MFFSIIVAPFFTGWATTYLSARYWLISSLPHRRNIFSICLTIIFAAIAMICFEMLNLLVVAKLQFLEIIPAHSTQNYGYLINGLPGLCCFVYFLERSFKNILKKVS